MANIECWLGNCVIFQGIRTDIAKKTNSFAIFQAGGGGGQDLASPLDLCMLWLIGGRGIGDLDCKCGIYCVQFAKKDSENSNLQLNKTRANSALDLRRQCTSANV